MQRNLALEFVRVTESAAIASSRFIGKGDKMVADQAAVDEMRGRLNDIDFCAKVVIGEGEKDEAPMLYTGEVFCQHSRKNLPVCSNELLYDIAVDPLECTDSVAYGRSNALTIIVVAENGKLLRAPDVYMDKIAVGQLAADILQEKLYQYLDRSLSVADTLNILAKRLSKNISDIVVGLLDRERHQGLIKEIISSGASVRTFSDGDVGIALAPSLPNSGIDCLLGIGASTEGVLAASALRTLGGGIAVKFTPKDDLQKKRLDDYGINDLSKIYFTKDLADGDEVTFTATGVLDSPLLSGVRFMYNKIATHSVVMRSSSGTVRYLESLHQQ